MKTTRSLLEICLTLLAAALLLPVAEAAAQDSPVANCPFTRSPIVIDGVGDEPVWDRAVPLSLVDVAHLEPTPHSFATTARITWDRRALYVLFEADDDDVWSVLDERDDPLYNEEVVELFIDPDGDERNYVEIEINPVGTVFDLLVTQALRQGGRGLPEWNPEFESAVAVQGTLNDPSDVDEGWSVEIALPWEAFDTPMLDVKGDRTVPPDVGDRWRVNLYRYERLRAGGEATGTIEYSAWSPTGRIDFHVPERFGTIVFTDERTAVETATWGQLKRDR